MASTTLAKRKAARISWKGIPVEERKRVAMLLTMPSRFAAGLAAIAGLKDSGTTPRQVWAHLKNKEALEKADEEAKEADRAKERAANIRKHAIENLQTALRHLMDAHDAAVTIEDEMESPFDSTTMGKFVRLTIEEAGEKLEQSLCNLNLIAESDGGYFVDDLKRDGAPAPQ